MPKSLKNSLRQRKDLIKTNSNLMFSSYLFDKGRMTLDKLKDKHNVDAAIEHVKVVYPD